jgi:hypothetical protein
MGALHALQVDKANVPTSPQKIDILSAYKPTEERCPACRVKMWVCKPTKKWQMKGYKWIKKLKNQGNHVCLLSVFRVYWAGFGWG